MQQVRQMDKNEVEKLTFGVARWEKIVKELQRPSSAVLEAFLLPTDDPLVNNARRSLIENPEGKSSAWIKCEGRHRYERETVCILHFTSTHKKK